MLIILILFQKKSYLDGIKVICIFVSGSSLSLSLRLMAALIPFWEDSYSLEKIDSDVIEGAALAACELVGSTVDLIGPTGGMLYPDGVLQNKM